MESADGLPAVSYSDTCRIQGPRLGCGENVPSAHTYTRVRYTHTQMQVSCLSVPYSTPDIDNALALTRNPVGSPTLHQLPHLSLGVLLGVKCQGTWIKGIGTSTRM